MDDHLVIMQSSALKARHLERHLGWLLGTKTTLLSKNSAVILYDKPAEDVITRLKQSNVKSVNIGAPIETIEKSEPAPTESKLKSAVKKIIYEPVGRGAEILGVFLGEDWAKRAGLEDSLDESNLKVNLQITYFRNTTKNAQKVLDSVATSLRNMEPEDVSVDLVGGGTIKGDELKLSGKIKVDSTNGILDETSVYDQMHRWVVSQIQNQEIEIS